MNTGSGAVACCEERGESGHRYYVVAADVSDMTGPHPSKYELEDATVYVHEKDDDTAQVTHIDVEHPDINEIIEPGENTYVGGKEGGVFVGLKDEMLDRAAAYLEERKDGGGNDGDGE